MFIDRAVAKFVISKEDIFRWIDILHNLDLHKAEQEEMLKLLGTMGITSIERLGDLVESGVFGEPCENFRQFIDKMLPSTFRIFIDPSTSKVLPKLRELTRLMHAWDKNGVFGYYKKFQEKYSVAKAEWIKGDEQGKKNVKAICGLFKEPDYNVKKSNFLAKITKQMRVDMKETGDVHWDSFKDEFGTSSMEAWEVLKAKTIFEVEKGDKVRVLTEPVQNWWNEFEKNEDEILVSKV